MDKEELIALFKEKLGGWSYEGPQHDSPENKIGTINHYPNHKESLFLISLDKKGENINFGKHNHIGTYDYDDTCMIEYVIEALDDLKDYNKKLHIPYDERKGMLSVIGCLPLSEIKSEEINSQVGNVVSRVNNFYEELDNKIDELISADYGENPIKYEDFNCPKCGKDIHITHGCCLCSGEKLEDDEIECPNCLELRNVCRCPECGEEITQDSLEDEMKLPEVVLKKIAYKRQVLWQLKKREEGMPRDILASEREKKFLLSQEIKGLLPEDFKNILVRVDAQWKNILEVRFRIHKFLEIYILMESDDWENALSPFIGMLPALSKMSGEEEFKKSEEYKKLNDLYLSVR